jgi:hypothetical protein
MNYFNTNFEASMPVIPAAPMMKPSSGQLSATFYRLLPLSSFAISGVLQPKKVSWLWKTPRQLSGKKALSGAFKVRDERSDLSYLEIKASDPLILPESCHRWKNYSRGLLGQPT